MLAKLDRLDRVLTRFETAVMVVSMATITLVIAAQVCLRYIFNDSLPWAEELVRYVVVWMSFIGAGMGVAKGAHVAMGLLSNLLPQALVVWSVRLAHLAGMLFASLLMIYGTEHVLNVTAFGQVSSAMRAPMGLIYACLPLGAALFFLRLAENFLRSWLTPLGSKRASDMLWTGGT
ncbi:MAG: TRAP transporter small permease [Pseudomonadota bacterium]